MDAESALVQKQAIKSSLLRSVTEICQEACSEKPDLEVSNSVSSLLTLLLFDQLVLYGKDLEVFARHAGRNVIRTSDVLLLVRHSEKLTKFLEEVVEQQSSDKTRKEKKRKEN